MVPLHRFNCTINHKFTPRRPDTKTLRPRHGFTSTSAQWSALLETLSTFRSRTTSTGPGPLVGGWFDVHRVRRPGLRQRVERRLVGLGRSSGSCGERRRCEAGVSTSMRQSSLSPKLIKLSLTCRMRVTWAAVASL